ncbi:MAG: DUF6625 family protein [Thermoanaerobaculia bacterium]
MTPFESPWLIMLIPYFGRWPQWINLFIESCKWNPSIRWRLYTDCGEPANKADNVDCVHLSFAEYKGLVRERLGIAFDPPAPYKLCDLKPCLGHIHERDAAGFRFFGYGDIDVIYGNIRSFYTDDVLAGVNVLSTHPERLSGHFAVLRNTRAFRRAFECIPNYQTLLEQPHYANMDEGSFTSVFSPSAAEELHGLRMDDHLDPCRSGLLFVERNSTVLSPRGWHDGTMSYPQRWFWRRGRLTNERDADREFLYLHFMRWQSGRWMSDPPLPGEAAWLSLERIIHVDWRRAATEGFCISPAGFTQISPSYPPFG